MPALIHNRNKTNQKTKRKYLELWMWKWIQQQTYGTNVLPSPTRIAIVAHAQRRHRGPTLFVCMKKKRNQCHKKNALSSALFSIHPADCQIILPQIYNNKNYAVTQRYKGCIGLAVAHCFSPLCSKYECVHFITCPIYTCILSAARGTKVCS